MLWYLPGSDHLQNQDFGLLLLERGIVLARVYQEQQSLGGAGLQYWLVSTKRAELPRLWGAAI